MIRHSTILVFELGTITYTHIEKGKGKERVSLLFFLFSTQAKKSKQIHRTREYMNEHMGKKLNVGKARERIHWTASKYIERRQK